MAEQVGKLAANYKSPQHQSAGRRDSRGGTTLQSVAGLALADPKKRSAKPTQNDRPCGNESVAHIAYAQLSCIYFLVQ